MQHKNGTVRFRKRLWAGLQNVRYSDTRDKNGARTSVSWVIVLCFLTHPPPQPISLHRFLVFHTTHYRCHSSYCILLSPVHSIQTLKGDCLTLRATEQASVFDELVMRMRCCEWSDKRSNLVRLVCCFAVSIFFIKRVKVRSLCAVTFDCIMSSI